MGRINRISAKDVTGRSKTSRSVNINIKDTYRPGFIPNIPTMDRV